MEPIGLAVGIIGLAGLFSTCLDLAEKIDDYKHFKNDERALAAQFVSFRLRFEKWGKALGLDQAASNLSEDRHEALTDAETLETVRKIFDIIREILSDQKSSFPPRPSRLLARSLTEPFRITPGSRREKLAWALKGKGKREDQVELFGKLVQHLYHLVPPESITRTATTVDGNQPPDPAVQIDPQPGIDNQAWTAEIRDTLQRLEGKAHAETRRELHAWIVRHPPNEICEDAIQKRLEDTCEWILERPILNEWLCLPQGREAARVLWINGPAGFGKTILCAQLVQHLQKVVKTPVAHFFFSSDFESRDDPYEAIRCWISEVISHSQLAFDYVRMKRETQHESVATRAFILQLFSEIVRIAPGCVFVIDGLDECTWLNKWSKPGRGDSIAGFLEKLDRAIAKSATRLLIVSRDEPEIRSGVENMESLVLEYSILPEDVNSDTRQYARNIVDKKLSKKSDLIRSDISTKMAERCGGQFLWLKLQEDSLRSWKNQKQLQETIDKAPPGLDSLYERNWVRLSQLPEAEKDRAFSLLRWAAFALRPLTVAEIAEAALIDLESDELPVDELPDLINDDYINSEIIGICGSLLSIRKSSTELDHGFSTIRLTHFSVKQYFLSHSPSSGNVLHANEKLRSSNERIENIILAQLCLRYIHYEQIWQIDREQDTVQGSFVDYAAGYWHRHAHSGNLEDKMINEFTCSLFEADSIIWTAWKSWFDSRERELVEFYIDMGDDDCEKERRRENFSESMPHSLLFYASTLNLTQIALELLEKDQSHLDDRSFWGETALSAACKNSNEMVAKALIEAGAKISTKDYCGETPLHLAVTEGCLSLVQLLLEAGAESTAVNYKQVAPLHHAAHEGYIDIAESLIQHGADIEAQDDGGVTPLQQAARHGSLDVIKLLVRKGAAIETAIDNSQQTALHHAAINGQTGSAKLLLDYGANIDSIDNDMCTPLFDAAFFGFTEVSRLLLSQGADMEKRGMVDETALIVAAKNGYPETTQLLLDRGANILLQDSTGWNALLHASFRGSVDAVRVLLKHGIDITYVSKDGYDALSCAATGGHVEVARLLLEYGANVAASGNSKRTPLGAAISRGHLEMTELLLSEGAAYEHYLEYGWLPLPWASFEGHVKIAEVFLDLGAELTEPTANGLTPLLAATLGNKPEMVKFLLERGAGITATICDANGDSPLRNAIFKGNTEIIKLLLDSGVDVYRQDDQGWRPLGLAAHNGHVNIIKLLLESDRGVDISATDADGWTPLHSAADGGNADVVEYLLQEGAQLKELDYTGKTAMHIASRNGRKEVVEMLLRLCSSDEVNRFDDHKRTPLFYAAMRGHSDVVKVLLSSSTLKVNLEDIYGATALTVAVRNCHLEIVDQLLASKAIAIDSKDCFGKTIQFWGNKTNNTQMVTLLCQVAENGLQTADESGSAPEHNSMPFNSKTYWCDVCTRCIPINAEYFECSQCHGGDFLACQDCVTMGANCLDESHIWTAALEQVELSSEEEDG